MSRSSIYFPILIFLMVMVVSCSNTGGDVTMPDSGFDGWNDKAVASGDTICLGLWQFVAEKATGNIEISRMRSADKILNGLGFMEPPALTYLDLDWDDINIDFGNGTIDVGVILRHPLPDPRFTGFDLRGVVFGPEVTNADGLTIIPSPEYFTGVSYGYINGLLGIPDSTANFEGLAGYKYFCADIGEDDILSEYFSLPTNIANRGHFPSAGNLQRNYHLDWNDVEHDFLVFNYAVYVNYDWPVGPPPYDLDDFSISTANCAEAFCCSVTELDNTLWSANEAGGGTISMEVEIWDWQLNISDVKIESVEPGVISETNYSYNHVGSTDKSIVYGFENVEANPSATGDLDILITVTDPVTFGDAWFMNLLPPGHEMFDTNLYNCFMHTTTVEGCPDVTITSIDPDVGGLGETLSNVTITGTGFVDGPPPPKDVKLTMDALTIQGENIDFHDETTIYVDFNIPNNASYLGDWYVEVTNGCGNWGVSDLAIFEISEDPCGEMDPFSTVGYIGEDVSYNYLPNGALGVTCTRTGNIRLVSRCMNINAGDRQRMLTAWDPDDPWEESYCVYAIGCPSDRYVVCSTGIPCGSDNTFYYAAYKLGNDFEMFKMRWIDGSPGSWGAYTQLTELPNDDWRVRRVSIDTDDHPIVLAYDKNNTDSFGILHYNNSNDWDIIYIAEGAIGDAGEIFGFEWNPVRSQYVVAHRASTGCNLYSIDGTGAIVDTKTDVFDFSTAPIDWYPALYIDRDASEKCHIIVFGKYTYNHPYLSPMIRYDAYLGGETTCQLDFGGHDPYHCDGPAYTNVSGGLCGVDDASGNKRLYFPGYDTIPGVHNRYLAYADLPADW